MNKGYVSLVLHSHMPFVRHPEVEDSLEERWLFEAINECYIPLIQVFDSLVKDNIRFKITMSITPPLMTMLQDDYLNSRYEEYLIKSIELSEKELIRTKYDERVNTLASFYNARFKGILNTYNQYNKRIMNAFVKFNKSEHLEIITCSATHAILPLLNINPETVKAQLQIAVESYEKCIGHAPNGIWLPECAYTNSLDEVLKEFGIKYFISESKAIINSSPKSIYGTSAPISTPNGIHVFGRDMESSKQVWSSFMGYPGDFNYREFYRDIGYELPMEYIAPYINGSGIRIDTGLKYYKISGKTENKEYYNRENAMHKVVEHASHFVQERDKQIGELLHSMELEPIILCPYDTELYGHWWFEGPDFINEFIRKTASDAKNYELTTPMEYIKRNSVIQYCNPSPSSWGENSDFSVWLNPSNHWVYRELHSCAQDMIRLANTYKKPNKLQRRALNQAARELMLAESSDWPFIINNKTTVLYANKRVNTHIERFNKLYELIVKRSIDESYLNYLESLDNIFPNMDYKVYKSIKS